MHYMDLISCRRFICVRLLCFATETLLRCGGLQHALNAHHGVTSKTSQGVFGILRRVCGYPSALLTRRHHVHVSLWETKISLVFVRTGNVLSVIDVDEAHAEHCLMATTKIMLSFYKK